MKAIIYGANGVMGKKIKDIIDNDASMKVIAQVDPMADDFLSSLKGLKINADVVIDFSHPANLDDILEFVKENRTAALLCTTGYKAEDIEKIELASKTIPILQAGNTSVGIAVLKILLEKASELLSDWDFEVIEAHHNRKIDSPSGTAEEIIKVLQFDNQESSIVFGRNPKSGKRETNEIGVHSIRGGSIVGDHTVIFAGQEEVIEIKHKAISRDLFATGAIRLAKFIKDKEPGLYKVEDAYK
jgi:4-hydroxy-tetrahydrodipicolinate reductase